MANNNLNPQTPLPWSKKHKKVTKASSGGLPYSLSNSFAQPLTMKELLDWSAQRDDHALIEEYFQHSLEYTPNGGSTDLKEAIAGLYGDAITADNVLVFPGGQVALQTVARAICHADMNAIAFVPGYQSVVQGPGFAGAGSVTEIELEASNRWQIDVSKVKEAVQEKTTYLVLNEPYNPAGTLMSKETQSELIALAREKNLYVLCDEVYRLLEHNPSTQLTAMGEAYEKGISVVAMSKPWGGCGITIGWIVTQDLELLDRLTDHQYFGTACVSRASEIQALMVLRESDRILKRNLEHIRHNKTLLQQFMADYGEFFEWVEPTAGAICAIRFKGNLTSNELGMALAEVGIGMKPAFCFTDKEDIEKKKDYFRVGYGEAKMPKALDAFRRFVEKHKEEWRTQMA